MIKRGRGQIVQSHPASCGNYGWQRGKRHQVWGQDYIRETVRIKSTRGEVHHAVGGNGGVAVKDSRVGLRIRPKK